MANFMGPMAPPQAAPQTPPQLDIRTNPGQRAQFKTFMQGMSRPAAPPTTAPIAPMLPAPMPSPMDQIDIFAPAPMADGGVVGGLQDLGKMSGQMVEALNTVVYGGGQGGGFGSGMSSGGGFGGGNMPAPLPSIQPAIEPMVQYGSQIEPSLPFARPIGGGSMSPFSPMNDSRQRPLEDRIQTPEDAYAQAQAMARKRRNEGFMGRVVLPGEMSFDAFAEGYNNRLNNPMQPLQATLFEDGGVADPYAVEGKIGQSVGPSMAGGTTNLIDASGNDPRPTDEEMGVLANQLQLGQDLYDVNQSYNDSSRPMFGMADLFAPGGALSFAASPPPSSSAPNALQNAMNFAGGIMQGMRVPGPMGGTFSVRPVMQQGGLNDSLGIMANFSLPFEDGGPVRMFMGGDPQAYGDERGRQDTSETAQERQRVGGTTNVFEGDSAPGGDDDGGDSTSQAVDQAVAAVEQMEAAQQLRDDIIASMTPTDLAFGAPYTDTSGRNTEGDLDRAMDQAISSDLAPVASINPVAASDLGLGFGYLSQPLLSEGTVDYPFYSYPDPVDPPLATGTAPSDFLDRNPQPDAGGNLVNPLLQTGTAPANVGDPMTDPYRGMGAGDFDFGPALPRDADIINNLLNRRVNYTTRGGNVIDRTVQDDLIERGKPSGLPGLIGKGFDILGANKAGKYLDQIAGGAPGVIDAKTGQLMGYVGEGFIKGSQVFSGRPGYNPFTGDAQNVRFDPSTNSYIVTPGQPNQGDDDNRASSTPPPATDTTDTTPPPVVTPPATPPAMPDPMDVVVPSARVADPLGLTPPSFAPIQSVGLPQSFLDLLASFNRPAPVAMQDGGAVLDQAAGNFLEALKVA